MGNPLQDRRTATEWASVRQVIEFEEIIESFSSLAEVVEQDLAALEAGKRPADWRNAPIRGRVEFGYADTEGRIPSVQGVVTASVDAVCQRCLEPFRLELEVEPRLLLLDSEDTVAGFEEFDVWELDERLLRPHDIVEELVDHGIAVCGDARQPRGLPGIDVG